MDEIYCDECGAQFRNQCHCEAIWMNEATAEVEERWTGMDGHVYVGDPKRASQAYHDTDNCRCPGSANFDPDSWY
jgi:hypothetical protein